MKLSFCASSEQPYYISEATVASSKQNKACREWRTLKVCSLNAASSPFHTLLHIPTSPFNRTGERKKRQEKSVSVVKTKSNAGRWNAGVCVCVRRVRGERVAPVVNVLIQMSEDERLHVCVSSWDIMFTCSWIASVLFPMQAAVTVSLIVSFLWIIAPTGIGVCNVVFCNTAECVQCL